MADTAKQRIKQIWRAGTALLYIGQTKSYLECGEGIGLKDKSIVRSLQWIVNSARL